MCMRSGRAMTLVGILRSRADAERAVGRLRRIGVPPSGLRLVLRAEALSSAETEGPGVGPVLGSVVGAAGGASLAGVAVAFLIPGVGPVLAYGPLTVLLALGGVVGGTVGAAVGAALDAAATHELARDKLAGYRDAVRGRRILVAATVDEALGGAARHALEAAGAERVEAA